MSCMIDYPTAGGEGAVDAGGFLVSCCGQWLRPNTWDPVAPCRIVAKVYAAGAAVDAGVPNDGTEGTLLPDNMASGGDFHFNISLIPDATVGGAHQIKVWLQNLDTGQFNADGPIDFNGCEFGVGGCADPPCLGQVETVPCELAIDQPAPQEYRVGPDLRATSFIGEALDAWKQGELKFAGIKLEYSFPLSSPSRAVWTTGGDSRALRLEVVRAASGFVATLYLLQASNRGVEPPRRWRSKDFNLNRGGVLRALTACCKETDATIYVSVPDGKKHCEPERTVV
ncbi:MAG TPA: hypothetical protein VFB80_20275 [Pirellulaceae bacterium]|nr:hypothetical protein [Pirellulaceae bacterium]